MPLRSRRRERGFTVVELLAAAGILLILAATAMPLARWDEKRRRESQLRMALETMRTAIDRYKDYADRGLIVQTDVEQMGYPLDLEELVDGVEIGDPESPEPKSVRFLPRIPVDPFTGTDEWGLRSYQDDWDSSSWGGENVYDVYMPAAHDTWRHATPGHPGGGTWGRSIAASR